MLIGLPEPVPTRFKIFEPALARPDSKFSAQTWPVLIQICGSDLKFAAEVSFVRNKF